MDTERLPPLGPPSRALAALAAANTLLHAAVLGRYGWFRDELYYVACGRRLDWGYVDHPPFVALVARLGEALFGLSPAAVRVLPVLAGSLAVVLAGLLARELGGGPFAQALAALAVMVAPVYLFLFHILSMNVFDVLFWTLAALLLARILSGGDPRLWLLFGLICGVGLENKHSMLFLGVGVAAGLVLTGARRHLATPWPWLGGLLAAALFLPNVLWEIRQGWPTLEFIRNAEAEKNVHLSPLAFLREQVLLVNPVTLPLWVAGLAGFFFSRRLARFRALGWIYLAVLALLLVRASKPYYLAPAYPILFAGGAVVAEELAGRRGWAWLKPASLALLIVGGAALAPLTLPLLPEPAFVRYAAALGIQASSGERHRLGVLPQHFADMHGWPEMAAAVGRVWQTIPAEERGRCAVFGQNYGEAAAVELLGDRWGVPDALSAHNNYYLWGLRGFTGECVIVLNDDRESLDEIFGDVRQGAVFRCPLCMPFEDEMPIWICRRPKVPLAELWPRIKHYE